MKRSGVHIDVVAPHIDDVDRCRMGLNVPLHDVQPIEFRRGMKARELGQGAIGPQNRGVVVFVVHSSHQRKVAFAACFDEARDGFAPLDV